MRRSREGAEGELNLVPILNLVSILIPFLLVSAQFVNLAVIDTTLPAICADCEAKPQDTSPPLLLSVAIDEQGFVIQGAEDVLGDDGEPFRIACLSEGCADDGYDYAELTRALALVKDEYPDDDTVILMPGSDVPYKSLVGTMDACRDSPANGGRRLFPLQTVAGGS